MTIPRYGALHRHWRRHPRPEWLVAGYLGYKPPSELTQRMMARSSSAPAPAHGRAPPPTGGMQALFASLGGAPGKTVVLAA
jgi:hypothetical protein